MPTDSTLFDTLTAIQQDVLQALVAGQSISAAAKAAGIHRSTVHRWTQNTPTSPALCSQPAITDRNSCSTNSAASHSTLFDTF